MIPLHKIPVEKKKSGARIQGRNHAIFIGDQEIGATNIQWRVIDPLQDTTDAFTQFGNTIRNFGIRFETTAGNTTVWNTGTNWDETW